jgi:hypothetical protein
MQSSCPLAKDHPDHPPLDHHLTAPSPTITMTNNSENELGTDAEAIARDKKNLCFIVAKRKFMVMYLDIVVDHLLRIVWSKV